MAGYRRTLSELRKHAVLHWPPEILKRAGASAVLPLLIATQEKFLALLKSATASPTAWRDALPLSGFASDETVFLKHLMVLSDLGGETLNKLEALKSYFPGGKMKFWWDRSLHEYKFKVIGEKTTLTNQALKVDAKGMRTPRKLDDKAIDVVMLLLYGSQSEGDNLPEDIRERCVVGSLVEDPVILDRFVRENYLRVSRQTGGQRANALGQAVQDYVIEQLTVALPRTWKLERNGTLSNVNKISGGNQTTFDVVARAPNNVCFAVEVSFQVTTNSTIERKSRESESLKKQVNTAGHIICYVIDGAGNINVRTVATSILCANSDCTVAMSDKEIKLLADFFINEANKQKTA